MTCSACDQGSYSPGGSRTCTGTGCKPEATCSICPYQLWTASIASTLDDCICKDECIKLYTVQLLVVLCPSHESMLPPETHPHIDRSYAGTMVARCVFAFTLSFMRRTFDYLYTHRVLVNRACRDVLFGCLLLTTHPHASPLRASSSSLETADCYNSKHPSCVGACTIWGTGGPTCSACPKGTWAGLGTFSNPKPDCTACPTGSTTASTGSTDSSQCSESRGNCCFVRMYQQIMYVFATRVEGGPLNALRDARAAGPIVWRAGRRMRCQRVSGMRVAIDVSFPTNP